MSDDARRAIPSLERLLASPAIAPVLERASRRRVVDVLRAIQDEMRAGPSDALQTSPEWFAAEINARLTSAAQPSLHSVINATGVVLHTNLGRAPLSAAALAAVQETAAGYSNLEYDVAEGRRGSRYDHCTGLLCELSGAQAALIVNNNAAALVLAFNTIAPGRDVVVSRGELVEIGDSFRIAEIVARSGATVREVGATNRTHLADYAGAADGAAAFLKVHPSNFQTSGFVSAVDVNELAPLARSRAVPLIYDLGSGLIGDLENIGLQHEATAAEALAAGADIVTMSGDKLLGGPQAGIILGRADLVQQMQRNPLCRALRVDKMRLAALEATLQAHADDAALRDLPALRMLALTADELRARAQQLHVQLGELGIESSVVHGHSAVGGGAYPAAELPTALLQIEQPVSATQLEARLRAGKPPVVARVVADKVVIDLRTVPPEQHDILLRRIADACR